MKTDVEILQEEFGITGISNVKKVMHSMGVLVAMSKARQQERESQWISVEDRLPEITLNKMSDWVITFDPDACRIDKAFYSKVTGWQAEHGEPMKITHWQPLPAPPRP